VKYRTFVRIEASRRNISGRSRSRQKKKMDAARVDREIGRAAGEIARVHRRDRAGHGVRPVSTRPITARASFSDFSVSLATVFRKKKQSFARVD
jgi:hypothetical protein